MISKLTVHHLHHAQNTSLFENPFNTQTIPDDTRALISINFDLQQRIIYSVSVKCCRGTKKFFHPKSCNRCYRDKSVLFQILKNAMLIIFTCMFKRCMMNKNENIIFYQNILLKIYMFAIFSVFVSITFLRGLTQRRINHLF